MGTRWTSSSLSGFWQASLGEMAFKLRLKDKWELWKRGEWVGGRACQAEERVHSESWKLEKYQIRLEYTTSGEIHEDDLSLAHQLQRALSTLHLPVASPAFILELPISQGHAACFQEHGVGLSKFAPYSYSFREES